MRIAARPSPESAARPKKSRAEAMSPAPRKASPRATRAAISAAENRGPSATGCGAGSCVDPGTEVAPGWSAPVATGSGVVSPAEAALGDAAATLTEDEPMAAPADGAAPGPPGASACSWRGRMRSRTRPTRTSRRCDSKAPATNQTAPRQITMPAGSRSETAYRRGITRGGVISSPAVLASGWTTDLLPEDFRTKRRHLCDSFAGRLPAETSGSIWSMRRARRLTTAGLPPEVIAISATRCAVKRFAPALGGS